MVFDASAKPNPLSRRINECMYKGPPLQPLMWDILIRARMAPNMLIGDIQQAFLQVGLKPVDRDAFRFAFELLDGTVEPFSPPVYHLVRRQVRFFFEERYNTIITVSR